MNSPPPAPQVPFVCFRQEYEVTHAVSGRVVVSSAPEEPPMLRPSSPPPPCDGGEAISCASAYILLIRDTLGLFEVLALPDRPLRPVLR